MGEGTGTMRDGDDAEGGLGLLRGAIGEAMGRLGVPGVAVGLLRDGWESIAGLGVTNAEHPLAVDADTAFVVGSIAKVVTATAAMRLVEAGRLDLDAPVRTYLPDLRLADADAAARVTARHLVTHRAGWEGDYDADTGEGDDALARAVAGMVGLPQLTPPGAFFSYNDAGFYLLGRVVEVLAGRPFEAAARDLVLAPLGMAHTAYFAADVITRRVAVGHALREGRPAVERRWASPRGEHPAGGLASTAADLLRFARFHLGDGAAPGGERLLAPATLALMRSALAPAGDGVDAIGVAWHLRDRAGARIVEHGGVECGFVARLLLVPARAFALVVLTNGERGGALIGEVVALALDRYLGVSVAEVEPGPLDLTADEVAAYAGRYATREGEITLLTRGREVLLGVEFPRGVARPPARATLHEGDVLIVREGPWAGARAEVVRDAGGRVAGVRMAKRLHVRRG